MFLNKPAIVYEVWGAVDGTQYALFEAASAQHDFLSKDVDDRPMRLLASFSVWSNEDAKAIYELVMECDRRHLDSANESVNEPDTSSKPSP